MTHDTYNSGSSKYAKSSNRLGYGFSALGSMVLGPSVRTIMLPFSDTPRVLEVVLTTDENRVAKIVIDYDKRGYMVVSISEDLNQKAQLIYQDTSPKR